VAHREPLHADYPFAGWLPTADGRLSFRQIGETQHPTVSTYANTTTKRRRLILCYQRRQLSDALFRGVLHFLLGVSGTFWFVLSASAENDPNVPDELTGSVHIYKTNSDWSKISETVRANMDVVNNALTAASKDRAFDFWEEELYATADVRVAFRLNRNGELFFSTPKYRDDELEANSMRSASMAGQDMAYWMANHAYFFIRDICHGYRHSAPTMDALLTLQVRSKDHPIDWRRSIIDALHYNIFQLMRDGDAKSLAGANRVLAYCMSFHGICERVLGEESVMLPAYNDEALSRALKAQAEEQAVDAAESAAEASNIATNRNYAIGICAIAVALLVMFVQPKVEELKIGHFGSITDLLVAHFPEVVGAVFGLLLIVWVGVRSSRPSGTRSFSPIVRDLLELSVTRRVPAIIVSAIGVIAVLAVSATVGWPAIANLIAVFRSILSS